MTDEELPGDTGADETDTDSDVGTDVDSDVDTAPAAPGRGGLSGRQVGAIVVAVLLVGGFAVGLIASKHQKDGETKSGGAAVATVEGVSISRQALDAEVNTWVANKQYVAAAAQQGQQMVGKDGQPTISFQRDILTQQIENVLFTREFNRRHLKVTAADESQLRSEVNGNAALKKYPKAFLDSIIERAARVTVLQKALQRPPTAADIQKAYDSQYGCPSGKDVAHILVATKAAADAIETQLQSGASFATLASSKSTDTGSAPNGGALGCLKRGTFVKEFEDAAFAATLNTPTAPVHSQFGWHIILVRPHSSSATPSLASVRQQIVQQLEQTPTQFNTFVDATFGKAKVKVSPALGAWQRTANGYAVVAPSASSSSTTGSGSAAGASGTNASTVPPTVADGRPRKP